MTDTPYTPVALDDLGVMPVDITIKTPYGRVVKMRVKPLTCSRWTEVGMQVADPPRPATENPATMRVWNEYRTKADEERAYRRVIEAVEGGGNPVPGTTPSEKVENWRKIVDQGIHNSILRFLVQVVVGDQKSVYADADRFLQEDGVDLRSCERFGLSLDQWRALPESDKRIYLAWDFRRTRALKQLKDTLAEQKKLTPETLAIIAVGL